MHFKNIQQSLISAGYQESKDCQKEKSISIKIESTSSSINNQVQAKKMKKPLAFKPEWTELLARPFTGIGNIPPSKIFQPLEKKAVCIHKEGQRTNPVYPTINRQISNRVKAVSVMQYPIILKEETPLAFQNTSLHTSIHSNLQNGVMQAVMETLPTKMLKSSTVTVYVSSKRPKKVTKLNLLSTLSPHSRDAQYFDCGGNLAGKLAVKLKSGVRKIRTGIDTLNRLCKLPADKKLSEGAFLVIGTHAALESEGICVRPDKLEEKQVFQTPAEKICFSSDPCTASLAVPHSEKVFKLPSTVIEAHLPTLKQPTVRIAHKAIKILPKKKTKPVATYGRLQSVVQGAKPAHNTQIPKRLRAKKRKTRISDSPIIQYEQDLIKSNRTDLERMHWMCIHVKTAICIIQRYYLVMQKMEVSFGI